MLLSLPVIAPDVPVEIDLSAAGERHLRLVLAMSKLDLLKDEDLSSLRRTRMTSSTLRRLIANGLTRRFEPEFAFKTISAHVQFVLPDRSQEEQFTSDKDVPQVAMLLTSSQPEWFAVGRALTAIEDAQPGLGRTSLRYLESTLCRFGMPHTPSGALEMCQMLHWMGEDDETMAMEEYGDDADVPRRAVIFEGVPEWAYVGYKEGVASIEDEDFGGYVQRLADRPFGKFLALVHRLHEANKDSSAEFFPSHDDAYPNLPPVVFGWGTEDDYAMIFDDNYRYYAEGGEEAEHAGLTQFDATVEGISNALPSILHTASVLRALDEALTELKALNNVI